MTRIDLKKLTHPYLYPFSCQDACKLCGKLGALEFAQEEFYCLACTKVAQAEPEQPAPRPFSVEERLAFERSLCEFLDEQAEDCREDCDNCSCGCNGWMGEAT